MESTTPHFCDLAMAVPTIFDGVSFIIFSVLPFITISIVIIILLTKKQKFIGQFIQNPLVILLILSFIFFFPRNYIELRNDYNIKKRCECFGIKSEVFGGNQYCSKRQQCLGITYSCQLINEAGGSLSN